MAIVRAFLQFGDQLVDLALCGKCGHARNLDARHQVKQFWSAVRVLFFKPAAPGFLELRQDDLLDRAAPGVQHELQVEGLIAVPHRDQFAEIGNVSGFELGRFLRFRGRFGLLLRLFVLFDFSLSLEIGDLFDARRHAAHDKRDRFLRRLRLRWRGDQSPVLEQHIPAVHDRDEQQHEQDYVSLIRHSTPRNHLRNIMIAMAHGKTAGSGVTALRTCVAQRHSKAVSPVQ